MLSVFRSELIWQQKGENIYNIIGTKFIYKIYLDII